MHSENKGKVLNSFTTKKLVGFTHYGTKEDPLIMGWDLHPPFTSGEEQK